MKQLILVELKRLVPVFLFFYLASFLAFIVLDISFFFLAIPAFAVLFSYQHLKRSSWYLNLPWSRAKVIGAVVAQNLIVFLVNLFIVGVIFFFEGKIFFGENTYLRLVAFIGYLMMFIISFFRSLSWIQIRKAVAWSDLHYKKMFLFIGGCGTLATIIWYCDIFEEPTFFIFFLLFITASIFSALLKEFVLPATSASKASKVLVFSVVTIFSFLVGTALVIANWDVTRKNFRVQAVSYLGRFPSFVSDQRALELFVDTDMGPNATMSRHLEYLQTSINEETWNARTLKCKTSDCLDLSSDVVKPSALSSNDLEKRFLTLMSFCEFQLGEGGRSTCINRRMRIDAARAKHWISILDEKGLLREWLGSEDTKKQIIALKGMSFVMDAEQEKVIRDLGESKDPRIKTAATMFIENSQKFRSLGLNCEAKKDQEHAICQFKQKEYSM